MQSLKAIVEQIERLPDSGVDSNFRQGHAAVLQQLDYQVDEVFLESAMQEVQEDLLTLKQKAIPHSLPEDYLFFLEFYGGLYIAGNNTYFSTYGIGPRSEEWYSAIISPDAMPEAIQYGFITVGVLTFHGGKYIGQKAKFFLDIAGDIQKHCVIGIGPFKPQEQDLFTVIKNISAYPTTWHKIADSFTHWLEQAAETAGTFDYL